MKHIIGLVLFTTLFILGCKPETKVYELAKSEAYILLNEHLIKELKSKDNDSVLLLSNRQLKSPNSLLIPENFDEIPILKQEPISPFPVSSKDFWNTDRISDVTNISFNEFSKYFKTSSNYKLEKEWDSLYGNNRIHNISYPIYNHKSKTALIKDYTIRPFSYCETNPYQLYFYKKTRNGWKKKK